MFRHIKSIIHFCLFLSFSAAIFFFNCAVDPEKDIITNDNNENTDIHKIHAWLWAFDSIADSLRVYHTVDHKKWASFSASMHPFMRIKRAGLINSNLNHAIWMAGGNTAYSFTDGLLDHGDHGHIVIPKIHFTVPLGEAVNAAHIGCSPDGNLVAFANDNGQDVKLINNTNGVVTTIPNGSGHSAALLTEEYVITTAATPSSEKWAKINDIASGAVVATIPIGTGAHGDAYYAAGKKAFIACTNGIYIIDVNSKTLKDSLLYTQPGRTNFLYHGTNNSIAVGLHKTDANTSDKILRLDLANEKLEYITITGATLDWKIKDGYFALSEDGKIAVMSDLNLAKIYHINLETKEIKTLDAPAAASAIATNYDGNHIWVLNGNTVSRIYVPNGKSEESFAIAEGTAWIFITSYKPNAEIFDNEKHEF